MFSAVRQVARPRILHQSRATLKPYLASSAICPPSHRTIVTTRYTKDHESVAFDDETGLGTVGITHFAQESLGDVVFVDLPCVGKTFSKGDMIGAVESVKAASDIYAPISGEVTEVNHKLNEEPGLVNRSPQDQGWLCKIKLSERNEIDGLLTPEAYAETCESH